MIGLGRNQNTIQDKNDGFQALNDRRLLYRDEDTFIARFSCFFILLHGHVAEVWITLL